MKITQITIEGIRGFPTGDDATDLVFDDGGDVPQWIVIAGRNGAGKSTFLRAVASAVVGPTASRVLAGSFADWIRVGENTARAGVRLEFDTEYDRLTGPGRRPTKDTWTGLSWSRDGGPEPTVGAYVAGTGWDPERGPWSSNPQGWFIAGYGPFRRLSPAPTDAQRLMMSPGRPPALASLFREDASLSEAIQWLKEIYLRRLENRPGAEGIENLLLQVLDDGLLPEGVRVRKFDSDGLWVSTPEGHDLKLTELSDGYRTVAGLVLDIIKQLDAAHGDVWWDEKDGDLQILNSGVVLIDEVDVHLHVEWQKRIGFWLKSHFPQIQFIVTTHSPFICQAVDEGGLVRLSPAWEDGPAAQIVTGEQFNRVVRGTLDDAVMSDMFGLDHVLSEDATSVRERLADLESIAMDRDLTKSEQAEIASLRRELPHTQSERAQAVARALQASNG
ncbi:AAA family ATPase [Tsukamurella sp. NPDC003166]|uniref:AAA family ATPase n=1 Tax=Tsukamurella sp. NPDC003166 TaxID=3154444 RepID=UPI0033B5B5E9